MKAYDAQEAVFRRRHRALSMAEARAVAAKLFAHFGVEPIMVARTRGGGDRSWYRYSWQGRPGRIHLVQDAPDWVVCHEVAHYVNQQRGGSRGHPQAWAELYVEAVRAAITEPYARRLAKALERVGLL